MFGSTLLIKVMERFPIVITVGAALIGFVAGEMVVTDPALGDWMSANFQMLDKKPILAGFQLEIIAGLAGALLVVFAGKLLARKQAAAVGESQEIPR
jgi:predicted tellurium resistance membrane protein TerC